MNSDSGLKNEKFHLKINTQTHSRTKQEGVNLFYALLNRDLKDFGTKDSLREQD